MQSAELRQDLLTAKFNNDVAVGHTRSEHLFQYLPLISDFRCFQDRVRNPMVKWSEMGKGEGIKEPWNRVSSFRVLHRTWENCTCWVGYSCLTSHSVQLGE